MAETALLEPPFGRGPLTVARVTGDQGRRVLPVPFVRMVLAEGAAVRDSASASGNGAEAAVRAWAFTGERMGEAA